MSYIKKCSPVEVDGRHSILVGQSSSIMGINSSTNQLLNEVQKLKVIGPATGPYERDGKRYVKIPTVKGEIFIRAEEKIFVV